MSLPLFHPGMNIWEDTGGVGTDASDDGDDGDNGYNVYD